MLKKLKAKIDAWKADQIKKLEMKKLQQYYVHLRCGALFMKYIYNDLENQKKTMNRAQKKRFETLLKHDGKFSAEIINKYKEQVDSIDKYIKEEFAKDNQK